MGGRAGIYVGCLVFVVLMALLAAFLAKFMSLPLAVLISGLALFFVFMAWFSVSYRRLLSRRRSEKPDDFDDGQA